jgi:hypothetical protein
MPKSSFYDWQNNFFLHKFIGQLYLSMSIKSSQHPLLCVRNRVFTCKSWCGIKIISFY